MLEKVFNPGETVAVPDTMIEGEELTVPPAAPCWVLVWLWVAACVSVRIGVLLPCTGEGDWVAKEGVGVRVPVAMGEPVVPRGLVDGEPEKERVAAPDSVALGDGVRDGEAVGEEVPLRVCEEPGVEELLRVLLSDAEGVSVGLTVLVPKTTVKDPLGVAERVALLLEV